MGNRNNFWKGLLACAALMAISATAFAVTEADIVRLKDMVSRGEQLSGHDVELAKEANVQFGSSIFDAPTSAESPRRPGHNLDDYQWEETDFEWIDISGTGTPAGITSDDQNVGPFDLGFSFSFYDQTYTSVRMCSNGWASFTSTSAAYFEGAIPSTVEPNNAVYCFWDDMYPPTGGQFFYFSDVANQRFIMSWINVPHIGSTTELYTYQIVLYANGNIRYNYQLVASGGTYNNGTCTVGIENAGGTQALQVCFDGAGTLPVSEYSILINQPDGVPNPPTNVVGTPGASNVVFTWDDPTQDTNGNPLTPDGIQIWQGPAGTGTLLGTANAGVETFNATGLQSGNYTFNLRAAEGAYFSAAVSVTAIVGNPSYFSDFETDNGDLIADAGWEWGTPSGVGPASAHSGTHCWGTLLAANYDNMACYNLDINQELTVGSDAATLEFWMWNQSESFFDGMNIKVSTDGGATWEVVTAVTPVYNEDAFYTGSACVADEVGWTGNAVGNWQFVVVNLGAYVGTVPIIRFSFGSDGSVQYPGFYIDDVTLWGFGEPVFAPVSGTITLDGGAGSMTTVSVVANGIGNPNTHPLANGTYSLPQVLIGNRVVTASLAGYHTNTNAFTLTEAGIAGVNITLTRVDPPVPTNLTGTVSNATGIVDLNWDNSTDPLVDVYPVYRRLQGEQTWVLQGTPTGSQFTQTLTIDGIYQYAVAARDNNVSTPVESDMTSAITLLYGALPVTSIGSNGNYDDRIVLNWLTPGISEGTQIFYDDSTSEIWFRVTSPNTEDNFFCQRMSPPEDATFPLMLYAATVYMEREDALPWVALCPPNATNEGADLDNPLYEWTDIGADGTPGWLYAETDGSVFLTEPGDFYIVIQFPPGITGPGCGSDNSAPDGRAYWTWPATLPVWNAFPSYDWMMRAWVGGPPPEGGLLVDPRGTTVELSSVGSPSGYAAERIPQRAIVSSNSADGKSDKQALIAQANSQINEGFANPLDRWFPPFSRAPEVLCSIGRENGRSLDDITNYRVYRQGSGQIAQVAGNVNTYTDLNRVENTPYTYWVTAIYDGSEESDESPHVTETCNMAPEAPANLDANPLGTNQMALAWLAPALNADGSALVDLAGYRVYRDGTQIGTTAAGVTTYIDTPPDNQIPYTWTVTAVDEVPNVSGPSNAAVGAIVSPWETVDFEWVDITTNGTIIVNADDINSGLMDLPFDFEFYGQTYTQFSVCSNGWLSFTSTSNSLGGTMPNAVEPNATVALNWMDLNPGAGGDVYMYDDAANGRLIISWVDVQQYANPTNLYTMQIILEPPTSIYFYYQAVAATIGTVGVENADGSDAVSLWQAGAGAFQPANNTGVAFWAGPSGAITGLVREFGSNAPIANAEVTSAQAPGEIAFTDAQGNYTLGVEPGTHTVTVHKQGYCDQVFENVVVDDGGTTTRNASLRQPAATFSLTSLNIYTLIGQNSIGTFEITNPNGQCAVSYTITTNQNWLTVNRLMAMWMRTNRKSSQ
ncbi:MAG: carboxypeptidase regulatory-like domain-containing protein [bacterium]|nr:carboxypeptidase regulatory-like domain-containing protein [bacterium]